MVNAPAHRRSGGNQFTPDQPESAAWPPMADWRLEVGSFDATSGLCQQPREIVWMKGLQTWRKPRPAAEAQLP